MAWPRVAAELMARAVLGYLARTRGQYADIEDFAEAVAQRWAGGRFSASDLKRIARSIWRGSERAEEMEARPDVRIDARRVPLDYSIIPSPGVDPTRRIYRARVLVDVVVDGKRRKIRVDWQSNSFASASQICDDVVDQLISQRFSASATVSVLATPKAKRAAEEVELRETSVYVNDCRILTIGRTPCRRLHDLSRPVSSTRLDAR